MAIFHDLGHMSFHARVPRTLTCHKSYPENTKAEPFAMFRTSSGIMKGESFTANMSWDCPKPTAADEKQNKSVCYSNKQKHKEHKDHLGMIELCGRSPERWEFYQQEKREEKELILHSSNSRYCSIAEPKQQCRVALLKL